jgi:hypothetical protein
MFEETPVESPFVMTYVGVALCVIMFPIRWISEQWEQRNSDGNDGTVVGGVNAAPADAIDAEVNNSNNNSNQQSSNNHKTYNANKSSTIQEADSFDEAFANGTTDYHTIMEMVTTRSVQNAKTKKPWNHRKHALAALQ